MNQPLLRLTSVSLLVLAAFVGAGDPCCAQDEGLNVDIHANSHATAKDIGLPIYPGAALSKEDGDGNSAANLGLMLNSFHFSLLVVRYTTSDSPQQVLDFYRKPLSRYGEVLECEHGKAVGTPKETRSGLTCSNHQGQGDVHATNDAEDHELRAGSPLRYRIVGIDRSEPGKTRFALVSLELPKDSNSK